MDRSGGEACRFRPPPPPPPPTRRGRGGGHEVGWVAGPAQEETSAVPKRPFLLPTQTADVSEAMEDFQRNCQRKAWERAFKALEKVLASNPNSLVNDPDGFMLSLRSRLWRLLAELPAEGKDAYRLFYDAEANKVLSEGG